MAGHIKDVEVNVLSAAYRTSQIHVVSTVKQSLTSIDAYILYCMYRQRGLQHCLSSDKRQCEGLIRGISDELVTRAFLCIWVCVDNFKTVDIMKHKLAFWAFVRICIPYPMYALWMGRCLVIINSSLN